MKKQYWIFSVRYCPNTDLQRSAIVGSAGVATVEAALRLANLPEVVRVEIRADATVRKFVEGLLDSKESGYYVHSAVDASPLWLVCIGSVQEVLG